MQTSIWSSGFHCHSLSLASVKSRLVLPFWYRLTRVVPDKGPLNGRMCVCVCVCVCLTYLLARTIKSLRRRAGSMRRMPASQHACPSGDLLAVLSRRRRSPAGQAPLIFVHADRPTSGGGHYTGGLAAATQWSLVTHAHTDPQRQPKTQQQKIHIYPYTRLTALCPGLPGRAGTRKAKLIWILLKQETVSGSGISWAICKSAPRSRQITTPASHHSVFLQAGCPSCRPANSDKALKAKSRKSNNNNNNNNNRNEMTDLLRYLANMAQRCQLRDDFGQCKNESATRVSTAADILRVLIAGRSSRFLSRRHQLRASAGRRAAWRRRGQRRSLARVGMATPVGLASIDGSSPPRALFTSLYGVSVDTEYYRLFLLFTEVACCDCDIWCSCTRCTGMKTSTAATKTQPRATKAS